MRYENRALKALCCSLVAVLSCSTMSFSQSACTPAAGLDGISACYASIKACHPDSETSRLYEEVIAALGRSSRPEDLCALAMLTSYYLGESNDELIAEALTKQGSSVVPVLKQILEWAGTPPPLCGVEPRPHPERASFIKECLQAINRGYVLWVEYPESLKKQDGERINELETALKNYLRTFNRLPATLEELQGWWENLGKGHLYIYNPWGCRYKLAISTGRFHVLSPDDCHHP